MKRTWIVAMSLVVLWVATVQAADPNDKTGITGWVLGGSPVDDAQGIEELRIGLIGILPTIEVAFGIQHLDAPPDGVEEWPLRGYLLAHALDAQLLASLLNNEITLPDGNLYGGLFGQYAHDRREELSGGWVVGGLVEWPKGWETVVEYQNVVWNVTDNEFLLMFGLRRLF